jgi:hypothetical protein
MMIKRYLPFATLTLLGLIACSPVSDISAQPTTSAESVSPAAEAAPSGDLTQLFSRIWRVTDAPSEPAPGSIYIFLANGTLLETSCVETYRVATWTVDKEAPDVLRVVEDGQLVFTAAIAELTDTTLQLEQTLVPSNEQQDLTLTAIDEEFVCPDLPR